MSRRIWSFHVEQQRAGHVLLLRLSGRVGSAAAPELEAALAGAGAGAPAMVLDLTGVDYISAPGIAALHAAARNRTVVLCGARPPVFIALDLAGITGVVSVEPDCQAALARIGGAGGE